MIKQHQRFFNILQVLIDALFLVLAYVSAMALKMAQPGSTIVPHKYIISLVWMVPLLLLIYYFMDVYSPMRSRLYRKEILIVLRAHLLGMVAILSLLFLYKDSEYSREVSLLFIVLGLLYLLLERFAVREMLQYLRKLGYNQKHMLIIGTGALALEFALKVRTHKSLGYIIVGFLHDGNRSRGNTVPDEQVIGSYADLSDILRDGKIDEVIVALPLNAHDKFGGIVNECEKAGIRVRLIPDYCRFLPSKPKVEEMDGIPLLNVRNIPLDDPFWRFLKRFCDICFSLLAICLTGPIMILIAIGIKLTSSGPVFFRQERMGRNNRTFDMLKFRSMKVHDDKTASTTWTTADDPRKTKFGCFLRKTSLDELPQFFNVLLGNMSVVGPRPERPHFVEQFKESIPKYMVKHQVKPGITGFAQINGWRGDTSIIKRIECDIYYIENWDLLFDLKILFLTVFKGLVNKNAY
jgi:Undecaprenyl-phosphate glucose phosphotransferase